MGDGEVAEGSVWEAFALADNLKTDNLIGIIDVNRLGQSRETMHGHDMRTYARKVEAFGWEAIVVEDGHDIEQVLKALEQAVHVTGKPVCVIARTLKGGGLSQIADKDNWHGKPIVAGQGLEQALEEVSKDLMKTPPAPAIAKPAEIKGTIVTGPLKANIEPAPYKKAKKQLPARRSARLSSILAKPTKESGLSTVTRRTRPIHRSSVKNTPNALSNALSPNRIWQA